MKFNSETMEISVNGASCSGDPCVLEDEQVPGVVRTELYGYSDACCAYIKNPIHAPFPEECRSVTSFCRKLQVSTPKSSQGSQFTVGNRTGNFVSTTLTASYEPVTTTTATRMQVGDLQSAGEHRTSQLPQQPQHE